MLPRTVIHMGASKFTLTVSHDKKTQSIDLRKAERWELERCAGYVCQLHGIERLRDTPPPRKARTPRTTPRPKVAMKHEPFTPRTGPRVKHVTFYDLTGESQVAGVM